MRTLPCLLDGLAFFRQFVSLSSPVEDLPRDHKAGAHEILRDEVVEIPKRHVKEAGAYIGNVLGLFDTTVYFGLLDFESRHSYLGPLLQRTISRALQIGRKTTHIRYRVQAEISAHITAEQVVELLFFCGKVIREFAPLILFCRHAPLPQNFHTLSRHFLSHHRYRRAVQFVIACSRSLYSHDATGFAEFHNMLA